MDFDVTMHAIGVVRTAHTELATSADLPPPPEEPAMPSITEDRDEILQLMYRYNHLIDSGDAAGWAGTFTPDGVFDVAGQVRSGRDELTAFAASVHGLRHTVANPVIDITGDAASVRAYFVVFQGTALTATGTYSDELVRTPAGWRFAKRVSVPDPR